MAQIATLFADQLRVQRAERNVFLVMVRAYVGVFHLARIRLQRHRVLVVDWVVQQVLRRPCSLFIGQEAETVVGRGQVFLCQLRVNIVRRDRMKEEILGRVVGLLISLLLEGELLTGSPRAICGAPIHLLVNVRVQIGTAALPKQICLRLLGLRAWNHSELL